MTDSFLVSIDATRLTAQTTIAEEKKKLAEQYFTPLRVSKIMAEMFSSSPGKSFKVLDPCCGVGNLGAAVASFASERGERIQLVMLEKDEGLAKIAKSNFEGFENVEVIEGDFFNYLAVTSLKFDRVILNPPYSKISPNSSVAKFCKSLLGFNETNLYTAFMSCCLRALSKDGELVAIVPRSFCNGTMFKAFRSFLFEQFFIQEIYLFESRKIFSEAGVSQEIMILKVSRERSNKVKVSHETIDGKVAVNNVEMEKIFFASDKNRVIHIPIGSDDDDLLSKMSRFPQNLTALGLRASTGKVVDFRAVRFLRRKKSSASVHLLYQDVIAPNSRLSLKLKAEVGDSRFRYIKVSDESLKLLVPKANYVLVRRISFKEAPSRIVCSPLLLTEFEDDLIGIENHLNYIWGEKQTLDETVSIALSAYLSTASVDAYIRRFSGHTQINAADLNSLPLPSLAELRKFGESLSKMGDRDSIELAEVTFFST